jgi:hypothetical protein
MITEVPARPATLSLITVPLAGTLPADQRDRPADRNAGLRP